jgi:hypothetical protein
VIPAIEIVHRGGFDIAMAKVDSIIQTMISVVPLEAQIYST